MESHEVYACSLFALSSRWGIPSPLLAGAGARAERRGACGTSCRGAAGADLLSPPELSHCSCGLTDSPSLSLSFSPSLYESICLSILDNKSFCYTHTGISHASTNAWNLSMCIQTYAYVCVAACMPACLHACMPACMHACMRYNNMYLFLKMYSCGK